MSTTTALQRLSKEYAAFHLDPPENCTAQPSVSDPLLYTATIRGPNHSPYADGTFTLSIQYPETYPTLPPSILFTTKIYHPNIDSETGFVDLNILHEDWSPVLNLSTILRSLQALLSDPDCEGAVVPEIALEYMMKKEEYKTRAREWTRKFAKKGDSDG